MAQHVDDAIRYMIISLEKSMYGQYDISKQEYDLRNFLLKLGIKKANYSLVLVGMASTFARADHQHDVNIGSDSV